MELNKNMQNKSPKRGNLTDPLEKERILMTYAGIFKNQIKQFGETVVKKHRPKTNYSR